MEWFTIIYKNFRKHIGKYVVCFGGTIIAIAMIFSFHIIRIFFERSMETGNSQVENSESGMINTYLILIMVAGILLLGFTLRYYIRVRTKDYMYFIILGIRKEQLWISIASEFGLIWSTSLIIGLITGYTMSKFLMKKLLSLGLYISGSIKIRILDWIFVGILCTAVFLIAFGICAFSLHNKSYSEISSGTQENQQEKMPRVSVFICLVSCMLFVVAVVIRLKYYRYNNAERDSLILTLFSVYGLLRYGIRAIGRIARNRNLGRRYLYIIKVGQGIQNNIHRVFVLFVLNFVVFYLVMTGLFINNITSSTPYRYDFLWKIEGDDEFAIRKEIMGIDGVDSRYLRYIVVKEQITQGEKIGISISDYNRITSQKKTLTPGTIMAVMQKDEETEIIFGKKIARLECKNRTYEYEVIDEKAEIIFWGYQPEVMQIIIFSDEDFRELDSSENWIVLQNMQEDDEYMHIHSQNERILKKYDGLIYYDRELEIQAENKERNITNFFYAYIGVYLILCSMVIWVLKRLEVVEDLRTERKFLMTLGMEQRYLRRLQRAEFSQQFTIPLVLAGAIGAFFSITYYENLNLAEQIYDYILKGIGILAVVECVIVLICNKYFAKLLEG